MQVELFIFLHHTRNNQILFLYILKLKKQQPWLLRQSQLYKLNMWVNKEVLRPMALIQAIYININKYYICVYILKY